MEAGDSSALLKGRDVVSPTSPMHAYVLLSSGTSLNLAAPDPWCWTDIDLCERLSRTYRWAGSSKWSRPMPVAQHLMLTLAIRRLNRGQITGNDAAFELLHDAQEGFIGFDCITPVKKLLGQPFADLEALLQSAVLLRYGITIPRGQAWAAHKQADLIAAASEAFHIVGWPERDIRTVLAIKHEILDRDPLYDAQSKAEGYQEWEPWSAEYAADRYLDMLRRTVPALKRQAS